MRHYSTKKEIRTVSMNIKKLRFPIILSILYPKMPSYPTLPFADEKLDPYLAAWMFYQ